MPLPDNYFELLEKNKKAFIEATSEEELVTGSRRGRDSGAKILKILKATVKNSKKLTDEQEDYLRKLIIRLEEGAIPKQTTKKALKALNDLKSQVVFKNDRTDIKQNIDNVFNKIKELETRLAQYELKMNQSKRTKRISPPTKVSKPKSPQDNKQREPNFAILRREIMTELEENLKRRRLLLNEA